MAGLSDLSLKLSYWFVSHRQQFRRWWFVGLLGLDFLLVVYVAIVLSLYLGTTGSAQAVIEGIPRTAIAPSYLAQHRPTDLVYGTTTVLARGDGRTDLTVKVQNANPTWAAVVHYTFTHQDQTIATSASYVAPKSIGYLLGINASLPETTLAVDVTLTVTGTDWIFAPAHPETVTPSFLVGSTDLTASTQAGAAATVVTGTITNTSVVGWREVPVAIVLTAGDTVIGVNQFTIRNWESLQRRDINVQWRRAFPTSAVINVLPVVNPFDQANVIR